MPSAVRTRIGRGAFAAIPLPKERIAGPTRYATAVAVADAAARMAWASWETVGLAVGTNYPDGLAGGVAVGRKGGVLLLSHPMTNRFYTAGVTRDLWDALKAHGGSTLREMAIFGSPRGAVGCALADACLAASGWERTCAPWDDPNVNAGTTAVRRIHRRHRLRRKWVSARLDSPTSGRLRKTLSLSAAPTVATARIACDTKYWIWINGKLVVFEGGLKRGPKPRETYYDVVDLAAVPEGTDERDRDPRLALRQERLLPRRQRPRRSSSRERHGRWTARQPALERRELEPPPTPHTRMTTVASRIRLPESNVSFDERKAAQIDGWLTPDFDDSGWPRAQVIGSAGSSPWGSLVTRPTPLHRFTGYKEYSNASALPRVSPGGGSRRSSPPTCRSRRSSPSRRPRGPSSASRPTTTTTVARTGSAPRT